MNVFIDTSGFLSLLDADDIWHSNAVNIWDTLLSSNAKLVTTNYVLVETIALAQHRFGIESVSIFQENVYPLLQIVWIDQTFHKSALEMVISFSRRKLSFVDCTSFEVMRHLGIEHTFSFDEHFKEQGFMLVEVQHIE